MAPLTGKFARELRTIEAMIGIYCRDHHQRPKGLCDDCGAVFAYAGQRLDKCLFPGNKPTCANCPVHCYKPEMRTRVKQIMRYAGPRMIYTHPYLAIRHILDGRNKGPFVRRARGETPDAAGAGPSHDTQAAGCCNAAPGETPPAIGGGRRSGRHPEGGSET